MRITNTILAQLSDPPGRRKQFTELCHSREFKRLLRNGFEPLEHRQLLAADVLLFADSFEAGNSSNDWSDIWVEDSQSDWFRSTQRSTDGTWSAEVDGSADDATLQLASPVDLSGYDSATLTFDWLIENGFDSGEYLALDISTNGGVSFDHQSVLQLNGNSDPENQWISESLDLTPFASSSSFVIQFRSSVSRSNEDANVDNVRIAGIQNPAEQHAEFIPLGFLPGMTSSSAQAVSADGNFVVGRSDGESFLWSRENDLISVGNFQVDDVSDDGTVVVGGDGINNAYRWESGTLTVVGDLTTIGRTDADPGGTSMSSAHAVSANGTILAGNTAVDYKGEADSFRIIGDVIDPIGDLPGGVHNSGARAISDDGSVVVGKGVSANGTEAYRWENGVFTQLGDLQGGTFESRAWNVSGNGLHVVGQSQSSLGWEAFLWSEGQGMIGLGHLPGETTDSRARAVNADGSVVVGLANGGQGSELRDAFIWDEDNGMRSLQTVLVGEYGLGAVLSGWTLNVAQAISHDGLTIAGTGTNPDGNSEAFVVVLEDLNNVPFADAGSDQTVTDADSSGSEIVNLNGSGTDSDGTIVAYEWKQGTTVIGNTASISPDLSVGTHVLTLTVTDDGGATASDEIMVTVEAPAQNDPNALYVYDIIFESRKRGRDHRAVFEIRSDNDANGTASDLPVAGVSIEVTFAGNTYTGTTDSNGIFRTGWDRLSRGNVYYANAVDLALSGYTWNPFDIADEEDDSDGDGRPDDVLQL